MEEEEINCNIILWPKSENPIKVADGLSVILRSSETVRNSKTTVDCDPSTGSLNLTILVYILCTPEKVCKKSILAQCLTLHFYNNVLVHQRWSDKVFIHTGTTFKNSAGFHSAIQIIMTNYVQNIKTFFFPNVFTISSIN